MIANHAHRQNHGHWVAASIRADGTFGTWQGMPSFDSEAAAKAEALRKHRDRPYMGFCALLISAA